MNFSYKSAIAMLCALFTFDVFHYLMYLLKGQSPINAFVWCVGIVCSAVLALGTFLQWRKM